MSARLSETYQIGDFVEIVFGSADDQYWIAGQVIGFQHPGLWVRTSTGAWFVTNTRRIRPLKE